MTSQIRFTQKISTKIAAISVIVTLFFVLMVFGILLSLMEQELMNSRRNSLKALVDVAFNLVSEYDQRVRSGELSLGEAKQRFISRIQSMRFQNHDYFWIQDNLLPYPTMIVHPADPSLDGTTMEGPRFNKAFAMQFGDSDQVITFPARDKNLLQAAVEVTLESGSGFISYDWPKPTATGLTEAYYPKLSYVKYYQPWGWIIGTGLYFDDIKAQMAKLRWTIILAVASMLGVTALMTLVVLRNITRPLGALLRYSGKVSRGDLDAQVSGKISGEFLQLKQSIEAMVQALRRSIQEARDRTEEACFEAEKSRQAEQALRESEERFQMVMEATRDGVWDWDIRTGKTYFNPGYYAMLGYAPGEFPMNFQSWKDLVHPDDWERVIGLEQECIDGHSEDFKIVYRMKTKDGQWRWVLGRGKTVARDAGGRALRMVGSHVDITDTKQAEEERQRLQAQLLQAQKMEAVGTLAGGVAHDFNNLLQAIGGHTQLMLTTRAQDDPERAKLMTIARAVERGGQLVQRLLLFGRKIEVQRRPVNLNQEVLDASKILERTILKMISIELRPAEDLWPVNADPVQLEQVLINLGVNASDAMPDGGRLVMATENVVLDQEQLNGCQEITSGRYVMLTVSDTGCGIDLATLDKIYDPFFTTKEMGKGTGLGLASVYGIVRDHGGCIICDSKPGQGTTFRIYLPAMKDERMVTQPVQAPEGRIVGGSETILVVDDEADLRDLTSDALQSYGYATIVAQGGQEALDLYAAAKGRIKLVLLDLNMPGMSGRTCLQELLRMDPDAKVLIASGYTVDNQAEKMIQAGALGFIAKPYQISDLVATVRKLLER
ncbi:MAG TPA: response regulator [Desulfonatronum sp.]|nr:response regulator [Desulfonatronum sp.]